MCPLTQEFIAPLGFLLYCPLIVPTYSKCMSSQYRCFLGISDEHIFIIVVWDEVDFMPLISYFQIEDGQELEGVHRHREILLCILGPSYL